jgi:hypothetical protein
MSSALQTFNTLAMLPLSDAQRVALLAALHRASGQVVPDEAVLAVLLSSAPASSMSVLPLSEAQRAALSAALTDPEMPAALSAALASMTGHAVAPPTAPPHPLGPDARFPPRVAMMLGVAANPVLGAPRALPGFGFSAQIVHFRAALRRPLPRRAIVLGGGYVGAELAQGWAGEGCAVTLLERRQELLRGFIPEQARAVHDLLVEQGVSVCLGRHVSGWDLQDGDIVVYGYRTLEESGQITGPRQSWRAELLVVAAGVAPREHPIRDHSM